jgi:hypothetical protein
MADSVVVDVPGLGVTIDFGDMPADEVSSSLTKLLAESGMAAAAKVPQQVLSVIGSPAAAVASQEGQQQIERAKLEAAEAGIEQAPKLPEKVLSILTSRAAAMAAQAGRREIELPKLKAEQEEAAVQGGIAGQQAAASDFLERQAEMLSKPQQWPSRILNFPSVVAKASGLLPPDQPEPADQPFLTPDQVAALREKWSAMESPESPPQQPGPKEQAITDWLNQQASGLTTPVVAGTSAAIGLPKAAEEAALLMATGSKGKKVAEAIKRVMMSDVPIEKNIHEAVGRGFQAMMVSDIPQALDSVKEAIENEDPKQIIQSSLSLAATAGLPFLIGHELDTPGPQIPDPTGRVLRMPEGAQPKKGPEEDASRLRQRPGQIPPTGDVVEGGESQGGQKVLVPTPSSGEQGPQGRGVVAKPPPESVKLPTPSEVLEMAPDAFFEQSMKWREEGTGNQNVAEAAGRANPDLATWEKLQAENKKKLETLMVELRKDPSKIEANQKKFQGAGMKAQFFTEAIREIKRNQPAEEAPKPPVGGAQPPPVTPATEPKPAEPAPKPATKGKTLTEQIRNDPTLTEEQKAAALAKGPKKVSVSTEDFRLRDLAARGQAIATRAAKKMTTEDRANLAAAIEEARKTGETEKLANLVNALDGRYPPEPKKARTGRKSNFYSASKKVFDTETESMGHDDVLSWIAEHMRMMSPTAYAARFGKAKVGDEYADMQGLDKVHANVVFGGGSPPNEIAAAMARENPRWSKFSDMKEFWKAFNESAARRRNVREGKTKEAAALKHLEADQKEAADWHQTALNERTAPGAVEKEHSDLEVGDYLEVDGVQIKVIHQATDGTLTLKDGARFGRKELAPGDVIYVEKFERPGEPEMTQGGTKLAGETGADDPWTVEPEESAPMPISQDLGAHVPAADQEPGSYVSNMFAAIDRDRAAMGKPPMEPGTPRTWDEDQARALSEMNRNPNWAQELIDEVRRRPRPLLSWENAGLVYHRAKLVGEWHNALSRINTAFEDVSDPKMTADMRESRKIDLAEAKTTARNFEDQISELDSAVGRGGTGSEAGRALQAQKMGLGDDMSLVEMRMEARAIRIANGEGDDVELRRRDEAEIDKIHKDYQEKLAAVDSQLKSSEARAGRLEAEASVRETALAAAKSAEAAAKADAAKHRLPQAVRDVAERISKQLDANRDAARQRIRERMTRMSIGLDPSLILDLAHVGAGYIKDGLEVATEWGKAMADDLGDWVKPHLEEIWKASHKMIQGVDAPDSVKQVIKRVAKAKRNDSEEQANNARAKIRGKVSKGRENEITPLVRKLAEVFYAQGIREIDPMIDKLHQTLQEFLPDITRLQTLDAYSGRGRWTMPNQDFIKKGVRELAAEARLIGHITQLEEAIANEEAEAMKLPHTGGQRDKPTQKFRQLTAQLNNLKKKVGPILERLGVTAGDSEDQLASSLQSAKTYTRNRMADLRAEIEARERNVKTKNPMVPDAELEALRAELKQVEQDHEAVFGKEEDLERKAKALERSIANLDGKIAKVKAGDLGPEPKTADRPAHPRLESITQQRDAKVKQLAKARQDAARAKRNTPEAIAAAAERMLDRQIAALEQDVDAGAPKKTRTSKPIPEQLVEKQAWLEALRQYRQDIRDAQNPKLTPDQRRLRAAKRRTLTEMAKLQGKIANGDYSPRQQRPPVRPDDELLFNQAGLKRLRDEWQLGKEKKRLDERKPWQRALEGLVKWERAFKLSSPVVFGKLAAAAVTRVVTTAAEEAVGGVLSKALPRLAEQAPREGGVNWDALGKAYSKIFTYGMRDAHQTLMRGAGDIDVIYGGHTVDKEWASFLGRLHATFKAPIKRAEFEYSLAKRTSAALKNGIDVSDRMVQGRLAMEAVNDAYRSIFMQRGFASDSFNNFVSMLEKSREHQPMGEISARVLRFLLPIVRVPTNMIAESSTGVHGAFTASARVMFHTINGTIGDLDPKTADSIMRQFKKGSIGLGLMAIGYFNADDIGGYDWRRKRGEDEAKAGGFQIRALGKLPPSIRWIVADKHGNINRWMTHAPWFELLQVGATIRHVRDQYIDKDKGEAPAFGEGMWAAGTGLIEETPFVGQMLRMDRLTTPKGRDQYLGELAKSTLVPSLVQKIAEWTDLGAEKRKPNSIIQHVEMGLPGLRENVPPAD